MKAVHTENPAESGKQRRRKAKRTFKLVDRKALPKIRENADFYIPEDLFLENEIETNRTVGLILMAFSLIAVNNIVKTLIDYSVLLSYINTRFILPISLVMVLTVLIVWRMNGFREKWVKYLFMGELLVFCGIMFFIFSSHSGFIFLVPTYVAARYFDRRVIRITFYHSLGGLFVICILNLVMDNHVAIIRRLHEWLSYNPWNEPIDAFSYILFPMLLATVFVGLYAFGISKSGRKLLKAQTESTEQMIAVQTELNTAAQLQQNVLPVGEFRCADGSFSISAKELPAKEVGGDFYDWFMTADGHMLVALIADVSDKGLSAAMFMMSAKKALRCALECCHSLNDAIALANRLICEDNRPGMFLTLWLCIIDTKTGVGKYINAGHLPPLLRHADGTVEQIENDPDLFLGTFPEINPRTNNFRMRKGDTLLLYTDGVTDAMNSDGESYGTERLLALVQETAANLKNGSSAASNTADSNAKNESGNAGVTPDPAAELRRTVTRSLEEFTSGAHQFDDITVLAMHCYTLQKPEIADLRVQADSSGTEECLLMVNGMLDSVGCPDLAKNNIGVVLDEVCCNICSYAYDEGSAPGTMELHAEVGENFIRMVFTDSGTAFDPTLREDPVETEEPSIGGLGIYFVRNLADSMEYRRENGKNILTVSVLWNM